jgi:hypothetical protein
MSPAYRKTKAEAERLDDELYATGLHPVLWTPG